MAKQGDQADCVQEKNAQEYGDKKDPDTRIYCIHESRCYSVQRVFWTGFD